MKKTGIIYKISSPNTDKVYIGSTTQKYLSSRKSNHVYDYANFLQGRRHYKSSYEILKCGDCVYDQIERVDYDHVSTLRQREAEIMRLHPNRVNKYFSVKQTREQQLINFNQNNNVVNV